MISTFASNNILNYVFGRQNFIVPRYFQLGLSTNPLGVDGVGFIEPTADTNYKRIIIDNDKISFSHARDKIVTIVKDFEFAESSRNWGILTHYMMFDENNRVWFYGNLQNSIEIEEYSAPMIDKNENSISINILQEYKDDTESTPIYSIVSTELINKILNHVLGNAPVYNPPAILYIGVSSDKPNNEGLGFIEPSANEYKRLIIPNDKNSFIVSTEKFITLAKKFSFPTSNSNWGHMKYFIISETPSGENILWAGELTKDRKVQTSTTLMLKPSSFYCSLDSSNKRTIRLG